VGCVEVTTPKGAPYLAYYNEARTHLSLGKDIPIIARPSGSVGSYRRRYSVASITATAESS